MSLNSALHILSPVEAYKLVRPSVGAMKTVARMRQNLRDIFDRKSTRLLVIVDIDCVADFSQSIEIIRQISTNFSDSLRVVARLNFDNLFDSSIDSSDRGLLVRSTLKEFDPKILRIRELLNEANSIGVSTAMEIGDIFSVCYFRDFMAWGCIGRRNCESQIFREISSGLPFPVGFEGLLGSSLENATNAIAAAQHPQSHLGINQDGLISSVFTQGNPHAHLLLKMENSFVDAQDLARTEYSFQSADFSNSVVCDYSSFPLEDMFEFVSLAIYNSNLWRDNQKGAIVGFKFSLRAKIWTGELRGKHELMRDYTPDFSAELDSLT